MSATGSWGIARQGSVENSRVLLTDLEDCSPLVSGNAIQARCPSWAVGVDTAVCRVE